MGGGGDVSLCVWLYVSSPTPRPNPRPPVKQVIAEALSGSVRLEAMPKAVVEVYVLVLQAHGGELGTLVWFVGMGVEGKGEGNRHGTHLEPTSNTIIPPQAPPSAARPWRWPPRAWSCTGWWRPARC